ncbi:MAG: GNAT family N-acetyltransferase [Polyangia bacterium]|jgi:acyl-CoA hydrolase/RimJ/RimL family protein N-acetyltransferase|nr:GNAT family N-acetyltransferase [Polyangia bacterium]
MGQDGSNYLDELRGRYPEKFTAAKEAFRAIKRGSELLIGSGCAEPRHLVRSLVEFVDENPKAFFDVEVFHLWNFGPAEYSREKYRANFRMNSFVAGDDVSGVLSSGRGDFTPIFPFQLPRAFDRGFIDLDVALVQVSSPDRHGFMSLGVSVDILKAAVKRAELVIAQVNAHMPRVHGDTFIHAEDASFLIPHDEPLLELRAPPGDEVTEAIGRHLAQIVRDGDTIQAGHGAIPNAVLANLKGKRDLGIHTDLLTDGMVELMRCGAVTNTRKSRDRGKTVATLLAGTKASFDFVDDNPMMRFMPIDYTNSPLVIASQENMLSIHEARLIDLTGQATEEVPGASGPRGIGGQADFIRGTSLAPGGTTIIALPSVTPDGQESRIVPALGPGVGVSNLRGDAEYVVTEHGYAFLHGRSLRERAMAIISIAHPRFRPWLLEEAKRLELVFPGQEMVNGPGGSYPDRYVAERRAKNGERILTRPVRLGDEDILKEFFYSLSDTSIKRRFISPRLDMHHERLQDFVVVDFSRDMVLLAVRELEDEVETVIGIGEYRRSAGSNFGEVAFAVRDDHQGIGMGTLLLDAITNAAVKEGLCGFTAEVLVENTPMMRLFEKMGFEMEKRFCEGTYELKMAFRR